MQVYDYVPGKKDWFAHNMPEGHRAAGETWIVDLLNTTFASCTADTHLDCLLMNTHPEDRIIFVLARNGALLGVVDPVSVKESLSAKSESPLKAGDLMDEQVQTFRPNVAVSRLRRFFKENESQFGVITTPAAIPLGFILRADVISEEPP